LAGLCALTLAGCDLRAPDYVQLTPEKRAQLKALRKRNKFGPEHNGKRNYNGVDDLAARATLNKIINDLIDEILEQPDGILHGDTVREMLLKANAQTDAFDSGDQDRASDYMLEIWSILAFHTATGIFGEADPEEGEFEKLRDLLERFLSGGK
jgi:hypothetical protein